MAATYSGDPSKNAKDAVRFLTGDTDISDALLQDAEISYLLAQHNQSPLDAAIKAVQGMIAKSARLSDESVGQVKVMASQRAKGLRDLLSDLRRQLAISSCTPYAGGISKTDQAAMAANADRVSPSFSENLMADQVDGSAEPATELEQTAWGSR